MSNIKFHYGENVPLEMHKVRIVQKLNLVPIESRLRAITEAGNNTFLLKNRDVFLDMLTDSGVNAMSDQQMAAMMVADDSYAGSETFTRLENKNIELFGKKYFLPAHQGRACENIISQVFVKTRLHRSDELSFYDHQSSYNHQWWQCGRDSNRRGFKYY